MNTPILTTKLYIPHMRSELVSRPRLIEHLNAGLDRKLALISAPAGFGKTTLVCEWLQHIHQPVAWLSLDENDNDPARFLSYLIAALQTVDPTVGQTVQAALQSPEQPPLDTLLTALINDLAALTTPLSLILDDYHLIEADPIHHHMNFLLDHLPPQLHLIITTRIDPPFFLSRRRGRAEVAEIRSTDLCFTVEEASGFLNTCMGLNLSDEDVTALEKRTEGWIVGLQMAALTLQGQTPAEQHHFVATFAGEDRYVMDYLLEEVLQRQPVHLQTFLQQTSILERLCGSLCDTVTGCDDGQITLESLDQTNLFIIPLDNRRHWYRYHHLFAELLQRRLDQSIGTQEIEQLHLRASEWYECEGFAAEAVSHALASANSKYAAELIQRHALNMVFHSRITLSLGWLRALPETVIRANPYLCLYRAWAELYAPSHSGKSSAKIAEQWLQEAEKAWAARSSNTGETETTTLTPDRFINNATALRVCLSRHRGDPPKKVIKFARQALEHIPEDDPGLRSIVLYVLGRALGRTPGNLQITIQTLDEARKAGEAGGNFHFALMAAYIQAGSACIAGQFQQAASICREILRTIVEPLERENQPLPSTAGWLYIMLGEILQEWGDLEDAERVITKGMALTQSVDNIGLFFKRWDYVALIRLKRRQGDIAGAFAAIEQMELLKPEDKPIAVTLRTRLWLVQAEHDPRYLASVARWVEEHGITLESWEQHNVRQLTLARLLIAQRRAAPPNQKQPDLQPLLRWLDRQLQVAQEQGGGWWVIDVLILQAMARQAQGDTEQALSALQRALFLAEPEGFVMMFVDEGAPMARLLYQAAERDISATYTRKLLAAFPDKDQQNKIHPPALRQAQARPAPPHPLIEPLSPRELEVLQLIAIGASNLEIAQELIIAVSTVKRHITHIFGKLGITNRIQAVTRARELELIE